MDVLRQFAVSFDFDRGEVRIRDTVSSADVVGMTSVPLGFDQVGRPTVSANCGDFEGTFVIDTGSQTNSVERDLFDHLVQEGRILPGSEFASMTLAGVSLSRSGLLNRLTLDSFSHQQLLCDNGDANVLGTRYLARYRCVFDFNSSTLYLKPGRRYDSLDPRGRSGLSIVKSESGFSVARVASPSPAQNVGLTPGDEILSIDGAPTTDMDLFRAGRHLSELPGKSRMLVVRRGSERVNVELTPEERFTPLPANSAN